MFQYFVRNRSFCIFVSSIVQHSSCAVMLTHAFVNLSYLWQVIQSPSVQTVYGTASQNDCTAIQSLHNPALFSSMRHTGTKLLLISLSKAPLSLRTKQGRQGFPRKSSLQHFRRYMKPNPAESCLCCCHHVDEDKQNMCPSGPTQRHSLQRLQPST